MKAFFRLICLVSVMTCLSGCVHRTTRRDPRLHEVLRDPTRKDEAVIESRIIWIWEDEFWDDGTR